MSRFFRNSSGFIAVHRSTKITSKELKSDSVSLYTQSKYRFAREMSDNWMTGVISTRTWKKVLMLVYAPLRPCRLPVQVICFTGGKPRREHCFVPRVLAKWEPCRSDPVEIGWENTVSCGLRKKTAWQRITVLIECRSTATAPARTVSFHGGGEARATRVSPRAKPACRPAHNRT